MLVKGSAAPKVALSWTVSTLRFRVLWDRCPMYESYGATMGGEKTLSEFNHPIPFYQLD